MVILTDTHTQHPSGQFFGQRTGRSYASYSSTHYALHRLEQLPESVYYAPLRNDYHIDLPDYINDHSGV
jgi:hypothetical protein